MPPLPSRVRLNVDSMADVRYLKNGCAVALRQLRDRITVQRSGLASGRHRAGARRSERPVHRAPPHRRGQGGRYRRADHRPLRTRRPRQRIDGARRLHHRAGCRRQVPVTRRIRHQDGAYAAQRPPGIPFGVPAIAKRGVVDKGGCRGSELVASSFHTASGSRGGTALVAGRASRRGSAKCVQAGTAVRRTLSRYNRAQRSGSLCIRHAYLYGIRWRRSPVTTLLTVYRHPIHRQPLRQPLLAIFFQAISLHPKHLHHSCSGRSGRASQPVPRHFAALPGSQFLEAPNEPRTGGGERSTSQTPAPPRFGLPTPTRGGAGPPPGPSATPSGLPVALAHPHQWPITPPCPAQALPSPSAVVCAWPMGCTWLCVGAC